MRVSVAARPGPALRTSLKKTKMKTGRDEHDRRRRGSAWPAFLPAIQLEVLMSKRVTHGQGHAEVAEDFLELRDDEVHDARHDQDAMMTTDDGVHHARRDLRLSSLALLHELSQTLEDDVQHAADLAGRHHLRVQAG